MFSNEKKNILAALFELQKEMYEEKVFFTKSADNPFFKSKYMPLPQFLQVIVPRLHKHGMVLVQAPFSYSGHFELGTTLQKVSKDDYAPISIGFVPVTVVTTILHVESGESVKAEYASSASDPQKAGAIITYGKRYGLEALLGVPTIDDDAESAMDRAKPAKKKKVQSLQKKGCISPDKQEDLLALMKDMDKSQLGEVGKVLAKYGVAKRIDIKEEHYDIIEEEIKKIKEEVK
jgi:hypothetical protein